MDQDTGPPSAVRVNELLDPTVSAMLFVETLSVPSVGADGDEPAPPLPEPPAAAVPVPVEVVGAGALLADEPPLPELGVVALPVGVDCDTLPVRDEGDGDAEGVVPDGFAWPGL